MVAFAAFLIILVILFGLENVRGFFFGTLGIVGWALAIILGLGAIISLGEWVHKEAQDDKKERQKQKADFKKNNPEEYAKSKRANKIFTICMISFMALVLALCAVLIISAKSK